MKHQRKGSIKGSDSLHQTPTIKANRRTDPLLPICILWRLMFSTSTKMACNGRYSEQLGRFCVVSLNCSRYNISAIARIPKSKPASIHHKVLIAQSENLVTLIAGNGGALFKFLELGAQWFKRRVSVDQFSQ
jgi:hypothetical protein